MIVDAPWPCPYSYAVGSRERGKGKKSMNQEAVSLQKLTKGINRSLKLLQKSDKELKRKREEARDWLKHNSGTNRTPEWIVDLNRRGPIADTYVILSGHDFWGEHQLRESLRSLFHFAAQACTDMRRHENAIAAYKDNQERSSREFDGNHPALLAQKDFLTYCASAMGFKETLDAVSDIRVTDASQINGIRDACFKSEIGVLIALLRNGLVHARVPSPAWSTKANTSTGDGEARWATLLLLRTDLEDLKTRHLRVRIEENRWHRALAYFDRVCEPNYVLGSTISLTYLVAQHFQRLDACYESVLSLFDANPSDCEQDFRSLLDSACSLYAA